jgi:Xaa-Pro aminopeptidase
LTTSATIPDANSEELSQRRARLLEQLPGDALVIVRGAFLSGHQRSFRQSNEFYYLTGLESPGCYLLADGSTGTTTLYVPHRDPKREREEGPQFAAEDPDAISAISGADSVAGIDRLAADLGQLVFRSTRPAYVPLAASEGDRTTRDSALAALGHAATDPFGVPASSEARLAHTIQRGFPQLEIRDLSPMLDRMRLVKSAAELALMREAGRLCGLSIVEAMRSTNPGIYEYELEAVADFVYRQAGARGGAYSAIVAGGKNAWHGHYSANSKTLAADDMVLMDYAPDYRYYTSDIGRLWPVSGVYSKQQRELYDFVVEYHRALTTRIRPGVKPDDVLDEAAAEMREYLEKTQFSSASYRRAAEEALGFRGHLSHPVGMAVHDVGSYRQGTFEPGLVISIDPMLWVPEERLYVRVEDTVAVTDDGIENFTGFVPLEPDAIEQLMAEPGILDFWARRQ